LPLVNQMSMVRSTGTGVNDFDMGSLTLKFRTSVTVTLKRPLDGEDEDDIHR